MSQSVAAAAVGVAGDRIGPYRIVRELGRGGMGEVWLAEHVDINSLVAIKLLRADPSGQRDGLERFLREAKATARIRHPGIIQVTDFGATPAGGAYLVMELLDGESLASRLARGRLPVDVAIELGLQIADALAAAHREGIVHRDLKPGNVFLVRDLATRGGARVKLLDFGVAKAANKVTDELGLTITGALVGTPLYMAPEQCASRLGPVDARADLYALGVVLYEAITGVPPFRGPSLGDILDQHLNATPASPRQSVPELPPAVDALVLQLLAKRREDRPADALAVARALATSQDSRVSSTRHRAALDATAASGDQLRNVALDATAASGDQLRNSALDATAASSDQPPAVGALDATAASGDGSRVLPAVDRPVARIHPPIPVTAVRPRRRLAPWIAVGLGVVAIAAVVTWRLARSGPAAAVPVATATIDTLRTRCQQRDGAACVEIARRELAGATPDLHQVFGRYQMACDAGDPAGCELLGDAYRLGVGVRIDPARAVALFRTGCAAGRGRSCARLVELERAGIGTPRDRAAASRTAARGCELGDPGACVKAGELVAYSLEGVDEAAAKGWFASAGALATAGCERGDGESCLERSLMLQSGYLGPIDLPGSFADLMRACELGSIRGCATMGASYVLGLGVQPDPAKGVGLLKVGCDHGEPEACETYAYSLAYGFGGNRDEDAARVLFERECNQRGDGRCHGLANIYAEGRGVPKDLAHSLELYQRACDAGTAIACSMVGNLSPDLPAPVRRDVLTRACDLGDSMGCLDLGMIAFKAGDQREAAGRFKLACAMSSGTLGCSRVAELYLGGLGVEKDQARALAMFERACDSGDQQGCHLYARRLLDGDSVPPDPEHGLQRLEQMCGKLWPASCALAAKVLLEGTVVRADPARAATFQAKACDLSPKYCPAAAGTGSGSGSGSGNGSGSATPH